MKRTDKNEYRNKVLLLDTVMGNINISGKEHYLHEYQAWNRALSYLLEENAYLKTRLAQVLDINTDKQFVDLAEHFQNSFIFNDELIREMEIDIRAQQEILKKSAMADLLKGDQEAFVKKQDKLRNEMEYFEKKFSQMKNEFNHYLVSHLKKTG
ncbi:MAG TPA: hypothetical protein DCQ34_04120 [Chitinophagaceae bacterium]|nr:hypothetical protein [Chitinophagaceae bacterium]HRF26536.1 hypothetical protein [Ferruginibacter sp.]